VEGYTYANGIDGYTPVGEMASDTCCLPDLCSITPESIACAFVGLLPSGPLWDKSKELTIACGGNCDQNCNQFGNEKDSCASLVLHAVYSARKLHYYIQSALWPSVRESNPYTAFTTMDSWLDRLGWQDCYNTFCRDKYLGEMTPYEVMGECGVEFCPPTFSEDLALIYKRAVITALWRMRLGFLPNLSSLNFILSSLYSELVPDPDWNELSGEPRCLLLRPTADYAPVVLKEPCPRNQNTVLAGQKQVKLYLTQADGLCVGSTKRAYPLTLAAHCIVLSLLPNCCTFCLKQKS
jgi:hypothetical protein